MLPGEAVQLDEPHHLGTPWPRRQASAIAGRRSTRLKRRTERMAVLGPRRTTCIPVRLVLGGILVTLTCGRGLASIRELQAHSRP